MLFNQATQARLIGALVVVFTVIFLALPLALGGHPGEAGAAPTAASHPA